MCLLNLSSVHSNQLISKLKYIWNKVNSSVTGPVVAQRVGRGIALLFHDRGTRRGWVVSNKPRPYFTPGKDPVPTVQVAGRSPGPVWTGGKSRPTGIRSSGPSSPQLSRYTDWASRPIFGEEYRLLNSSLCSLLHSPVTSSLSGPNIFLGTLFSNTLSKCSALSVSDHVLHPHKTTADSKLEDKQLCTEW